MGDDGGDPLGTETETDLFRSRRQGGIGKLQQQVALAVVNGQNLVLFQKLQAFQAEGKIATREDLQVEALGLKLLPELANLREYCLFMIGFRQVDGAMLKQVGTGYHGANSIRQRYPGHLERLLPTGGAVVQVRQDMGMKINHDMASLVTRVISLYQI